MPQGYYLTDFDAAAGRPVLPADADTGALLVHGFNTTSYTPADTCIVLVDAPQAVLDAMDADPAYERLENA